jgi:hypothetical protein
MRVLASILPGTGHLLPLVPSLHALRDAGHGVLVANAEPLRAEVEAVRLDFAPVGPPWHEADVDAILPGFRAADSARQLGMLAELAPTVLPDLLTLTGDMQQHLLMREPYEFAAWLAAERCQLPIVVHAIGVVSGVGAAVCRLRRGAAGCRPCVPWLASRSGSQVAVRPWAHHLLPGRLVLRA